MNKKSERFLLLTLSGLTTLFLMTLLTSCVTIPAPPAQYLEDCKLTYLPATGKVTNADIIKLAKDREYDLRECNLDKKAIRAWYDGVSAACGWRCRVRKGKPE